MRNLGLDYASSEQEEDEDEEVDQLMSTSSPEPEEKSKGSTGGEPPADPDRDDGLTAVEIDFARAMPPPVPQSPPRLPLRLDSPPPMAESLFGPTWFPAPIPPPSPQAWLQPTPPTTTPPPPSPPVAGTSPAATRTPQDGSPTRLSPRIWSPPTGTPVRMATPPEAAPSPTTSTAPKPVSKKRKLGRPVQGDSPKKRTWGPAILKTPAWVPVSNKRKVAEVEEEEDDSEESKQPNPPKKRMRLTKKVPTKAKVSLFHLVKPSGEN